jgi:hypothetical protein
MCTSEDLVYENTAMCTSGLIARNRHTPDYIFRLKKKGEKVQNLLLNYLLNYLLNNINYY